MTNYISTTPALRQAGITKHTLLQLESEWQQRFNRPLAIPENHLGYRQFSPEWVRWLKEACSLRKRGWSLLDISLELQPPSWQKRKLPAPDRGLAAAWYPEL